MKIKKKKKGERSKLKEILQSSSINIVKGTIIAYIITFTLLFIYSLLLSFTDIEESTMAPVVIIITGVSILARKLSRSGENKEKWNCKRTE